MRRTTHEITRVLPRLLLIFCAFAPGRVPFDERAYTCLCCLVPYTCLLSGGWYAAYRSTPECGAALFYVAYVFGIVYCAYFGVLVLSLVAFFLYCKRRGSGPFRGVPLYFIVVFAPLHFLMPGVPVMPLDYLARGPRLSRRRNNSDDPTPNDPENPDDRPEGPVPIPVVADVADARED